MAFYAESWLTEVLVALSLVVVAVYAWFSYSYKYWQRKGVPYLEPRFPFGNVYNSFVGKTSGPIELNEAYLQFKGQHFGGVYFFNRPSLMIVDPDLIRTILVKDFWTFQDRGIKTNENEPLNGHLFLLGGNKWRRLRVKLTPTFTSGKMKMMFQTLADCGREMGEVLEEPASRGQVVEMRELSARFATDVIASVAFGVEVNCQRNPEAAFRQWGRRIFKQNFRNTLNSALTAINPKLLTLLSPKSNLTEVSHYFRKMVSDTVKYREDNGVTRNDFMHLLIQLKNEGCVDSDRPGANKQKDEDDKWKTLRKYPPVMVLNRESNAEYRIPDSDVVLDKGTPIIIPVYGLHHDPDIFPDPERFDPERFSEEQKAQRHPYVYLPFGEGPRICIGMRFGLVQTKVGLINILSRYRVEPSEKSVRHLSLEPRTFLMTPKGGIHLRLSKRSTA
ncbi:probable cytochrome P450 6a14 isoform X2 [Schistocerca nitens]|uniref:probable cytochrome P450 6a14 isoform X2 n=1 Tax=Schistocerca nitens TaxID=7011 RepID=UPI0021174B3D|nr:probable cytochrome P450 6a14 isoform X2 [Schistocerca nitens]